MTTKTSTVEAGDNFPGGIERALNDISDADIRLLRIFCTVVASGGLSAATTELQADLSTVSRYIKELEDRVGVRLCNRGRAGFSLTPQGLQVHGAAQELFRALRSFRDNVNAIHDDPVGELRVGVMDALVSDPQFRMSDALRRFAKKAPRVRVHLVSAKPHDIERAVLQGDLDAGVVSTRERQAGLQYRHLYLERSSLYCAERHPLFDTPDERIDVGAAAALPFVEDPYTESLPLRGFSGLLAKATTAGSIEGVALLVKTGMYVGFLPDHYAAAISATVGLRKIRPDVFSYEQSIELAHRADLAAAHVLAFVEQLDRG